METLVPSRSTTTGASQEAKANTPYTIPLLGTVEEERDMAEFARDLGNIGSSASVFGDNDFFFESNKEVARSERGRFMFLTNQFLVLLQRLEI